MESLDDLKGAEKTKELECQIGNCTWMDMQLDRTDFPIAFNI